MVGNAGLGKSNGIAMAMVEREPRLQLLEIESVEGVGGTKLRFWCSPLKCGWLELLQVIDRVHSSVGSQLEPIIASAPHI